MMNVFRFELGVLAPLKMRWRRRVRVVLPLLEGPDMPIITALFSSVMIFY